MIKSIRFISVTGHIRIENLFLLISLVLCVHVHSQTSDWKVFNKANSGIAGDTVNAVTFQEDGVKWIGTVNGLTRFDDDNWTTFTMDNSGLPANSIKCLMEDNNGKLWIGTDGRTTTNAGGLVIFDGYFWDAYTPSNSVIPGKCVTAIVRDKKGTKWIGTDNGLVRYDGSHWTLIAAGPSTYDSSVSVLAVEKDSVIIIGTASGLSRYDNLSWMIFNTGNSGLPCDTIQAVAVDSSGISWIGTMTGGLAKFDDPAWHIFNTSNSGLPVNNVTSIAIDIDSTIWIGTRDGGLVSFYNTTWTVFDTSNSPLPSNIINSVSVDKLGNKWIGTPAGLAILNRGGIHGIGSGGSADRGGNRIRLDDITPNPFTASASVKFSMDDAGIVTIRIIDMTGRLAAMPFEGLIMKPGKHTVHLDGSSLPAGVYTCLLTKGADFASGRFLILK